MSQTLTWNLHGNDQLSGVLEKLDRTLSNLSRHLDGVTADAKQMGSALGGAEAGAQRMAAGASHATLRADGLASGLQRVVDKARFMAVTLGAAAVAATGALGFMAVKIASDNEQAAISFELLLGSAQKASAFLAELQKFAAATPFEMPQLRTAASRLLAVGTATADIIPLLTALGDATAGMGTGAEGIERSVTALTQMRQKTKVTAEEMLQLTEAGIPAWQTLASFLKVDVATAMKMVEKRTVDATVMFQALETKAGPAMQRLSGMMARQSQSLAGIWSTFKDNAGQALAKFAEPALPAIKKVVDALGQATPKVLDKLRSMGGQVADIFKGSDVPGKIFASLEKMGTQILPMLEGAWNRLLGTIRDNKEGLEKLGRFVADYLIPFLATNLVVAIDLVTAALQGVVWVAAHVVDAMQFMTQFTLENLGLIVHGAAAAFGWVPDLGPKLREAADKFDAWANGIMDKLHQLDGTKVKIDLEFSANASAWAALRNAERQSSPRATGGPTWAGEAYTVNEIGPERWIAATTGTVQPYNAGAGSSAAAQVFALDLTVRGEDGRVLHEKLLNFKANSGKVSLELG